MICNGQQDRVSILTNTNWKKRICVFLMFVAFILLGYMLTYPSPFEYHRRFGMNNAVSVLRKRNRLLYDVTVEPNIYVHGTPNSGMCFLRNKLERKNFPVIHSVFSDPVSKNVVFIAVRLFEDEYDKDPYACAFQNGYRTLSDPVVHDYKSFGYIVQYMMIITCPIPEKLYNLPNITVDLIRVTDDTMWFLYAIENLTVCPSGIPIYRYHNLAMCTLVKHLDSSISDWIEYHVYQGVDQILLYDNILQNESNLIETVQKYIDRGYVTVIPWSHEPSNFKTHLEVQIAHENDCIWRLKHSTQWVIKIDVDEFLQPMGDNRVKVNEILVNFDTTKIAALHVQNWYFGRPINDRKVLPDGNIFERNTWRSHWPTALNTGRDKSIIHPLNVHYFKIHGVKIGADSISLNPFKEMRLVHYRMENNRTRDIDLPPWEVQDLSMVNLWQEVQKWKLRERVF